MPDFERAYLTAIPLAPPLSYDEYREERQSFHSGAKESRETLSWGTFQPICLSYQPDTSQELNVVLPQADPGIRRLTPEKNIWLASATSYYTPLSQMSVMLDDPDPLLWRHGHGPPAKSSCDAYLELQKWRRHCNWYDAFDMRNMEILCMPAASSRPWRCMMLSKQIVLVTCRWHRIGCSPQKIKMAVCIKSGLLIA